MEREEEGVDWLTAAKRQRLVLLEDNRTKSKRLQGEGGILAENGRYWEAIKYWDKALQHTPASPVLHEMKAQVGVVEGRGQIDYLQATPPNQALMEVGEAFEAVQSAERAVSLSLTWSAARQTLGRAQLGIGEVHMVSKDITADFYSVCVL